MYTWYAELFHRPSILMVVSLSPLAAAILTASLHKLWPEKGERTIPAMDRAPRMPDTNQGIVRTHHESVWGPGDYPKLQSK